MAATSNKSRPIDATGTEKGKPKPGPAEAVEALESEAAVTSEEGETPEAAFITVRDQKFHLVDAPPGIIMLKLAAAQDPRTPQAKQVSAMIGFLEKVVVADERDAFMTLLEEADDPIIDSDEIGEILSDAAEALAARPTEPSSS